MKTRLSQFEVKKLLMVSDQNCFKTEKILENLGVSLSLFSAIRMQKAREFLCALKIQTREKKRQNCFILRRKSDVYSEGMEHLVE
jgi:hypothetical protein